MSDRPFDKFWNAIRWIGLGFVTFTLSMCGVAMVKVATDRNNHPEQQGQNRVAKGPTMPTNKPTQKTESGAASESTTPEEPEQLGAEERLKACRFFLQVLAEDGVLTTADISRIPPRFMVSHKWHKLDFEMKTNTGKAVECFLFSGKTGQHMPFYFVDNTTGKVVAKWNYNRLEVE